MTWEQSKQWGIRPSNLLSIEDDYVAYCFDQVVHYFGVTVEAELHKLEEPKGKAGREHRSLVAKRKKKFNQLLGLENEKSAQPKYADPAVLFQK